MNNYCRIGIGAFAVLLLTRYFGHHELEVVLDNRFPAAVLIALAFAKMVTISFTVTGGWRGGFIIPLFLQVPVSRS